jgi:glycosyltransferase involved in cell wall biosynthesis
MKRLSGKAVTEAEVVATVRLELDAPVQVSQWIAVSPYEKELIEAAGFGPVSLFCHSFEQVPIALTTGWHERTRITAVGAVHEHGSPNHDGLVWFMNSVYPKCRGAISDLTLTIVGHWRSDVWDSFRRRYPDADIDFRGSVSDDELRRIYDESRMTLAPTRFAAGVASKVLEAMSLGVPVVMTDLLEKQLVGTALAGRSDLAVGARNDDGRSFAGWIEVLAHDERRWNDLRRRQLELVEPLGGRAAFEDGVDTLLKSVGIAHRARL